MNMLIISTYQFYHLLSTHFAMSQDGTLNAKIPSDRGLVGGL